MLRVAIHPNRESIVLVAQTRDRNGHAADASDVTDPKYGGNPQMGYSAHAGGTEGGVYPQVDIDRIGLLDAVLFENDTDADNSLPAFYDYTQELSRPASAVQVPWPARNSNDTTETLWAYFGSEFAFRSVYLQIGVSGAYVSATLEVEYWNGYGWAAVPSRTDGSLLDTLLGSSDQISWPRIPDWFPCSIEHQFWTVEGSRKVVARPLFWVRMRLVSISGFTVLPTLTGAWEGDADAETEAARWPLVINPDKAVVARCAMMKDANAHLTAVPVVSRKAPATIAGFVDFSRGDYVLRVPTYYAESPIGKNDALTTQLMTGSDKNGTAVTVPVPAEAVVLHPGRYRARVYAEIPNLDANVLLSLSGHPIVPPDPTLVDPNNPEAMFDPTWEPAMTAATAHFDVRLVNAKALVEVQRNANTRDVYAIWLEADGARIPLVNQGSDVDYARLQVTDISTGAVLLDTMDLTKSNVGDILTPLAAPGGNPDPHVFRYIEDDADRKLQDRGIYMLTVTIVRGGQAISTDTFVSFFE